MDPNAILALLRPYLADLIRDVQSAFCDFDHIMPLEYRLSIEDARPKAMSLRVVHRWRQRFGSVSGHGAAWVAVDQNRMEYLFFNGEPFAVGVRIKKLDSCGQSYQHVTERQTELRETECFPDFNMTVAHVFLGYRYTCGVDDIVPALTDMSISSEYVTTSGGIRRPLAHADLEGWWGNADYRTVPAAPLPAGPPSRADRPPSSSGAR